MLLAARCVHRYSGLSTSTNLWLVLELAIEPRDAWDVRGKLEMELAGDCRLSAADDLDGRGKYATFLRGMISVAGADRARGTEIEVRRQSGSLVLRL